APPAARGSLRSNRGPRDRQRRVLRELAGKRDCRTPLLGVAASGSLYPRHSRLRRAAAKTYYRGVTVLHGNMQQRLSRWQHFIDFLRLDHVALAANITAHNGLLEPARWHACSAIQR